MTLNELTEKAVAEQMGALLLENTKFKALVTALQNENNALRARVTELEKPKPNGESHGSAEEAAGAA